jgi:hypothetical protein
VGPPELGVCARALCVVAALGLGCGCTYRLSEVPPPEAFERPIEEVLRDFPDAAPIFPDYSDSDQVGMARADDLLAVWGEPRERRLSWWNLWPGNWPFVPQYLWEWELGRQVVTCRIDHPFYDLYRATVCNCRIEPRSDPSDSGPAETREEAGDASRVLAVGVAEALGELALFEQGDQVERGDVGQGDHVAGQVVGDQGPAQDGQRDLRVARMAHARVEAFGQ